MNNIKNKFKYCDSIWWITEIIRDCILLLVIFFEIHINYLLIMCKAITISQKCTLIVGIITIIYLFRIVINKIIINIRMFFKYKKKNKLKTNQSLRFKYKKASENNDK